MWLAFAAAALAGLISTAIPWAVASSQGAPEGAVVRLSDVTGFCWSTDLSLDGSLQVSLPEGATVRSTYEVAGGGQTIDLGEESVTASATTSSTVPYSDEIWFGPRWVEVYPYTYFQRTVVTVDGVDVYAQVLEATCTADGADAEIVLSESFGPDGPDPSDGGTTPLEPRFVG